MNDISSRLNDLLKSYGSLAVALSGGVDSAVLLAAAVKVLGKDMVLGLTARAAYVSGREIAAARETAEFLGVAHHVVSIPFSSELRGNPDNRCFLCKLNLMSRLKERAKELGFPILADGSNADDSPENRPGMRALEGLAVVSPLQCAGLTKNSICDLAREWGLPSADRPPNTCLLTRFPSGMNVEEDDLCRVEGAEDFLRDRGYATIRVRDFGSMACIEVAPEEVGYLAGEDRDAVVAALKQLEYSRVTVDLEGYRFASMDARKDSRK